MVIQGLCGEELSYALSDETRAVGYIWWTSVVRKFKNDYPSCSYKYDLNAIVQDIVDATQDRLTPD